MSFHAEETITALSFATIYDHAGIVQYLVSAGAPVDAPNEDCVTSLMCACRNNRSEIAHFLLTHGADPNIQDQNNTTALHSACYSQMTSGVSFFLHMEQIRTYAEQTKQQLLHLLV